MVDLRFCMSAYLIYRYVYDGSKCFRAEHPCVPVSLDFLRLPVKDSASLLRALKETILRSCSGADTAIALSGGIDSAILARLVPKSTKAYTFRCVVPGVRVLDESAQASEWARLNGLEHEIVDIRWEDVVSAADICMDRKGAPIHSIEAQIYIAARKAVQDEKKRFIFGENADIIYGGMDGLLAKDWLFGEFVDRYAYVKPYHVLRDPMMPLEPFFKYEQNGRIDAHTFINEFFRQEALGTYINACQAAGISFVGPFAMTYLDAPIDYARIRRGDSKYLVRELFRELYPGIEAPAKIPMPRPMNEWLADWSGPKRDEFLPRCTDHMTGDQKWMVWCLERFLDRCERRMTCIR